MYLRPIFILRNRAWTDQNVIQCKLCMFAAQLFSPPGIKKMSPSTGLVGLYWPCLMPSGEEEQHLHIMGISE